MGTQGLILNFSFSRRVKDQRIIYEVMNVLTDQNISGLPILFVFDVNNKDKEVEELLQKEMTKEIDKEILNMIHFHYVDFQNDMNQLDDGFEWLCQNMKPLKPVK